MVLTECLLCLSLFCTGCEIRSFATAVAETLSLQKHGNALGAVPKLADIEHSLRRVNVGQRPCSTRWSTAKASLIPRQDCVPYCTILYYAILYYTILYYTVLYHTVLYCAVLYCTVLYCTVLYCTVLYCTVLYCTVLYCTVLYCSSIMYLEHTSSGRLLTGPLGRSRNPGLRSRSCGIPTNGTCKMQCSMSFNCFHVQMCFC